MPIGIPDRSDISDPRELQKGLRDLIIHLHAARRAGTHNDIRIGGPRGLYSFATRKELPEPGKSISLFPQPIHSEEYGEFEGEIPSGYGAGDVKVKERGRVLVTYVGPNAIKMTVAHRKYPERFTMAKMKDGNWLLMNVTPQEPFSQQKKIRFKRLEADQVDKLFTPANIMTAKVDGSATIYDFLKDHMEVSSYRTTKDGKPIIHTERVFGPEAGHKIDLPKHLQGSILRGEMYGLKDKHVIPPAELGGILNATVANSLEKQKANNIKLKNLIYTIYRYGKKEVGADVPYDERMRMAKELLQYTPKGMFHTPPEEARTPAAQKALWQKITAGKHPLTSEGVVSWPAQGGVATKIKTYPEADVWIREMVPGTGKYTDKGIGAFRYSLDETGPVVGKVGTGFDDPTRFDMYTDPDKYIGRVARIRAQQQFPNGAYRAPAFIALHEDYPTTAIIQEPEQAEKAGEDAMKQAAVTDPINPPNIPALMKIIKEKLQAEKIPAEYMDELVIHKHVGHKHEQQPVTIPTVPQVISNGKPVNGVSKIRGELPPANVLEGEEQLAEAIKLGAFSTADLLKLAEEASAIINAEPPTGNKNPRMGATNIKPHPRNRRWRNLTESSQAHVLPWSRGRKVRHDQRIDNRTDTASVADDTSGAM